MATRPRGDRLLVRALVELAIELAQAPALDDAEGWQLAARAWEAVLASEDAREGPRAFAERRAPNWVGR